MEYAGNIGMTSKLFSELGLSPALLKAIDRLGYEKAAPIQSEAIPMIMAGNDVIGQSQTGSGKTAAFGIPAVELCRSRIASSSGDHSLSDTRVGSSGRRGDLSTFSVQTRNTLCSDLRRSIVRSTNSRPAAGRSDRRRDSWQNSRSPRPRNTQA